jgi:uncharacterized membrane protein
MGGFEDAIIIVAAVTVLWYLHEQVIERIARSYGFKPEDPREHDSGGRDRQ